MGRRAEPCAQDGQKHSHALLLRESKSPAGMPCWPLSHTVLGSALKIGTNHPKHPPTTPCTSRAVRGAMGAHPAGAQPPDPSPPSFTPTPNCISWGQMPDFGTSTCPGLPLRGQARPSSLPPLPAARTQRNYKPLQLYQPPGSVINDSKCPHLLKKKKKTGGRKKRTRRKAAPITGG